MAKLPVLLLAHPLILFPSAHITIPVSKSIGEALISLSTANDAADEEPPTIAALPITSTDTTNIVAEDISLHGTAASVTRIVRPPLRNPRQPYHVTLHGLSRVTVAGPASLDWAVKLTYRSAQYVPDSPQAPVDAVEAFKTTALRLLDRLARDAVQQRRREGWLKAASMVEDITNDRAPWLADNLVAAVNGDFEERYAILKAQTPTERLNLCSALFAKQASISEVASKIAHAVDDSLSKQQKEFFLRQQLAAIQRELSSLQSSSGHGNGGLNGRKGGFDGSGAGSGPGSSSRSELDDDEQAETDDLAELKGKIEAMAHGSEERKMGVREWRRLKRIPQGSVENGVIRSYLEWLTAIPWPNTAPPVEAAVLQDRAFLTKAREQLDKDHFGLDKIKRRLIEYLAILRLRAMNAYEEDKKANEKALVKLDAAVADQGEFNKGPEPPKPVRKGVKGPILLFVGPPGTGKTSLGQSVAKALNRPFQRISLGGVRDEAEIRGHRRTYVASGPGLIVQALRRAGRPDPVLLLDEIDKIGQSNFHGDPGAALLEVLDPEQNDKFNDHYLNVPVDLSQVLFICTSNSLETISAPLLDRCEVVHLSGYTYDEKMHIARRFLLPKQIKANGLPLDHVQLTDDALRCIATLYTREAGVRSLERSIGAVVRHKAVEWAEYVDGVDAAKVDEEEGQSSAEGKKTDDDKSAASAEAERKKYKHIVDEGELEAILGIARWDGEEREREEKRGVVYGLVVSGSGEGAVMPVETIAVPGGGRLRLTGSLGDVIKESGELALSWVKMHAYDLCITNTHSVDPLKVPEPIDVHLHLPAGAQKKDGPSAGVAMTCALVSLLTGVCVPTSIAMTGEITLRGRVTPVGGIKEKVLGAHRAGVTKVIVPWANRKDVEHDVAPEIKEVMSFAFVRTLREALDAAFGEGHLSWRRDAVPLLESRL